MKTIAIIPARFASSRFPGKPLVDIDGKSMIQRVYEQVLIVNDLAAVIIATDDQRIFDHAQSFNAQVMMTNDAHPSGTDRCAEVVEKYGDCDLVLNVQGDEPFIDPEQIESLIQVMVNNQDFQIASLARKIDTTEELFNPNVVKVVIGQQMQALYFSRHPIPFLRNENQADWLTHHCFYKHLGLYAYRSATLNEIHQLPPSNLEKAESLEQLRWLENGYSIGMALTDKESFGIDTPEDLESLKRKL